MNPWLIRTLLAFLALEAGICVAFLADDWKPLRQKEDALFETVLSTTRSDEEFVLDESPPASRVRLVRPLTEGEVQPYFHIKIDEESTQELESYPPSPTDWRELLIHMHEVGCEVAAIEQPLSWEGDDLFHLASLASLDTVLNNFETAVLTVDLQRVPKSQPIPEYLRRSAIPLRNVTGEVGALVRVNRVLHAPSATAGDNILFSFRVQESVEEAMPAFVRWDDYLIPSFPLAVAMAQNQVSPEHVKITLGRNIRLGNGPVVPIDEVGQLLLTLIDQPSRAEVRAQDASLPDQVPKTRESAPASLPRCALFADSSMENPSPWDNHYQLQKIISSFDVLPRPDEVETHQRFTIAGEVAVLGLIAIVAALLIRIPTIFRHLTFLLLALAAPFLLVALSAATERWTPFAPVLATVIAGWILATSMSRYLPARPLAAAGND